MRVILVGSAPARARLRAQMNGSLAVVGEFATLAAARGGATPTDAFLLSAAEHAAAEDAEHADVGAAEGAEHADVGAAEDAEHADGRAAEGAEHADVEAAEGAEHADGGAAEGAEEPELIEALTPRETEVLELLAEGLSNKGIAAQLGISDQTVKFHVAAISGKLGAHNRTQAVRLAVRRGLIVL
jgi:DNA-binding NarL/FixJ family response regulator